jgi:hypothetical protein
MLLKGFDENFNIFEKIVNIFPRRGVLNMSAAMPKGRN